MTTTRSTTVLAAALLVTAVAGCSGTPADDVAAESASPSTSSQAPISPRISLAPAPTPTATADGFPLGEAVAVDFAWTVAVTAVSLDAAAAVTAVAPDATAPNGRFVLVDLTATPTPGGVAGSAAPTELRVQLEGAGETYGQCDDAFELLVEGLVSPGPDGAVSWQVCLDVPPEVAVPTSVVVVGDISAVSVGGSPVRWSLD